MLQSSGKKTVFYCHDPKDVPKEPHYAIVGFITVSTPGWDRGDPPNSEQVCNYTAYTMKGEWEEEVKRKVLQKYPSEHWVALQVTPASINVDIVVGIKSHEEFGHP